MAFPVKPVHEIEMQKFKANPVAVSRYSQGKALLMESGIFHFLRIFARPFSMDRGQNPYSSAYTAAFSEGYNKALDDLQYFDEQYLTEELGKKPITPDFGGLSLAYAKGDLKPGEIKKDGRT